MLIIPQSSLTSFLTMTNTKIIANFLWLAQILCGADMFEKRGVSYTYGNRNAVGYEKICIIF